MRTLGDIAKLVGAELIGASGAEKLPIKSVAPLDVATGTDVSFLARADYEDKARATKAAAIFVSKPLSGAAFAQLVHPRPYYAFAKTAQLFWQPRHPFAGQSERAFVHAEAVVDPTVIFAENVWIGPKAQVGAHAVLYPGCFIGEGAVIGADTVLRANVVIEWGCRVGNRVLIHGGAVLGGDGFGFAPGESDLAKIPQVGIVVIEDDVEIGPCCTVDRATMGETRIGMGTKLDSHVHIAHNVQVGKHTTFSGFSGVAGSAKIGDWVMTGGHSAINGHIEIANHVHVGAMTAVVKSIDKPGAYIGFPAIEAAHWRRQTVYLKRLGEMDRRIRELEKKNKEGHPP